MGVNPARAGMIRANLSTKDRGARKPRASGDDPIRHELRGRENE